MKEREILKEALKDIDNEEIKEKLLFSINRIYGNRNYFNLPLYHKKVT